MNNLRYPRLFLRSLHFAFLDKILPLLDIRSGSLCTAFHCSGGLATYKLGCLLGAINRIIIGRHVLLLRIIRLGGFPDFLGKLIFGKFQRPLLWQDIFTLFLLDWGT